jgi:uncharacterized protein YbjT (DUF2867 family)
VAIADLAGLAAIAIEQPSEFAGRRIAIASDELTAARAAEVLARVTGHAYTTEQFPADELPPGLRALFEWLEHRPGDVDIAALRRRHPGVGWHDYERWVRSQRARLRPVSGPAPSPAAPSP